MVDFKCAKRYTSSYFGWIVFGGACVIFIEDFRCAKTIPGTSYYFGWICFCWACIIFYRRFQVLLCWSAEGIHGIVLIWLNLSFSSLCYLLSKISGVLKLYLVLLWLNLVVFGHELFSIEDFRYAEVLKAFLVLHYFDWIWVFRACWFIIEDVRCAAGVPGNIEWHYWNVY